MKESSNHPVLSVIAPCYNEEQNIPALVERTMEVFKKMGIVAELILVNDGSTDNTRFYIEQAVNFFPGQVVGVFQAQNGGMEKAWKAGLLAARASAVCVIDADLQYLPEDIARLYKEYTRLDVDMVQGWRTSINRERGMRYFFSITLNAILNICFGMHARDNKSGFILTRKDVLTDILHHARSYYYFQTFITVAAHAKGYSLAQIEVLFDSRRGGESFLSSFPLKVIFLSLFDLVQGLIEYRFTKQRMSFLDRFISQHSVNDRSTPWSKKRQWYFGFYLFLMPLHHWLVSRRVGEYFFALRKTQWLQPKEIQELQLIRLRSLLEHAYRHVPYWRDMFDELGFKPDDVRSLDDLAGLPLLEKQTVRERVYFDLLADNNRKSDIQRISTSGSTGQPLICYADRTQLELRWASTLRSQEWTGYRFGDRCLRLWHQTIGMSRSQVIREWVDALLTRRIFIPAFQIDEHNIRPFLKQIERAKPVLIDGYAESFNFLSVYLKEHNLTTAKPAGIISSAQMLPRQSRQEIERAFNTKVYDKYGSREFSGIAYECEAGGGHHVAAESYIVEIIKDGQPAKPGEMGEVVITDLNNYAMPFIRYRVGDLARAVEEKLCTCGRGLPKIGDIEGRTQSIIVGTQKQYVPGSFFLHYLKEYDYALKQFQIEQKEFGSLTFRIVKTSRFNDQILADILDMFQKFVGPKMQIDVEFVEVIPLSRTGKVQVCISKLNLDFQKLGV